MSDQKFWGTNGAIKEALDEVKRVQSEGDDLLATYVRVARTYVAAFDQAMAESRRILRTPSAWHVLPGLLYRALYGLCKSYKYANLADAHCTEVLDSRNPCGDVCYGLATIFKMVGSLDRSEAYYELGLSLYPNLDYDFLVLMELGMLEIESLRGYPDKERHARILLSLKKCNNLHSDTESRIYRRLAKLEREWIARWKFVRAFADNERQTLLVLADAHERRAKKIAEEHQIDDQLAKQR